MAELQLHVRVGAALESRHVAVRKAAMELYAQVYVAAGEDAEHLESHIDHLPEILRTRLNEVVRVRQAKDKKSSLGQSMGKGLTKAVLGSNVISTDRKSVV